jgi:hypothetical protein
MPMHDDLFEGTDWMYVYACPRLSLSHTISLLSYDRLVGRKDTAQPALFFLAVLVRTLIILRHLFSTLLDTLFFFPF